MTSEITPGQGNPSQAPASDLIAALRDKAPKVALALAAGQAAWPGIRALRVRAGEYRRFTVKVSAADDMYDDLHEWVLSLLPKGRQRALEAWSSRAVHRIMVPGEEPEGPPPGLRLRYDGTRQQPITIGGHKIQVGVTDPIGSDESRPWRAAEIVFTATSAAARDCLLGHIEAVLRRSRDKRRKPVFRMLGRWGEWERLDDLPPRDLDSVILPAGQLERLTADLARWLAAEADYARRCIPWHRGYLLEGPPGTGKTSVARALASHFGMDVWYLPLADVAKDGDLIRNISRVSPRSMLLLEDADVFHAATVRDQEKDTVTLSGLLNSLDGIASPHGVLTVLTTNTPEVLDDAVVRAGRVDLVEHFGLSGPDEVRRIVERYYGEPAPNCLYPAGVAPADVVEACKRHDKAADALAALADRNGEPVL